MLLPGKLDGEGQTTRSLLGTIGELAVRVFSDGRGFVRLCDEWRCVNIRSISLNYNPSTRTRYCPNFPPETLIVQVAEGENYNTHHLPLDRIAFTEEELAVLMRQHLENTRYVSEASMEKAVKSLTTEKGPACLT